MGFSLFKITPSITISVVSRYSCSFRQKPKLVFLMLTRPSALINPFLLVLLVQYNLSTSSLWCKRQYMVSIFLVVLSIASGSFFPHSTIPVRYLIIQTSLALIACMVFPTFRLAFRSSLIHWEYSFVTISYISLLLSESNCNTLRYLSPFFIF